jgi:hypothetical protein
VSTRFDKHDIQSSARCLHGGDHPPDTPP